MHKTARFFKTLNEFSLICENLHTLQQLFLMLIEGNTISSAYHRRDNAKSILVNVQILSETVIIILHDLFSVI